MHRFNLTGKPQRHSLDASAAADTQQSSACVVVCLQAFAEFFADILFSRGWAEHTHTHAHTHTHTHARKDLLHTPNSPIQARSVSMSFVQSAALVGTETRWTAVCVCVCVCVCCAEYRFPPGMMFGGMPPGFGPPPGFRPGFRQTRQPPRGRRQGGGGPSFGYGPVPGFMYGGGGE